MKIVQLGPFPPPNGGVATNVVAIHRALLARDFDAHVVNITGTRRPSTDRVLYPGGAVDLVKLLLRMRPDVLHIHVGGRLTARLMALCLVCTMVPRARKVLTVHSGGYAQATADRPTRRLSAAGFIFRRFDRVVVVNEQMRRLFEGFGVPPEKVRLITPYSATPVAHGSNGRAVLPDELEKFCTEHEPLLVTVGALEPEYDLDFQVRLLPEIVKAWPDVGLLVIGDGSQRQSAREALTKLAWPAA